MKFFIKNKLLDQQGGFTLMDIIVYTAMVGLVVTALINFTFSILDSRNKNYVTQEVNSNMRIAMNTIKQKIHSASGINIADSTFDTDPGVLSLTMSNPSLDPTIIRLNQDDGTLQLIEGGTTSAFTDDSQVEFDAGTYSNTQWDSGNSWLELTATGQTAGTGTYSSNIFNANQSTNWTEMSWIPERPYGKPFPSSGSTETAYSAGNANMSSNVLLMHLDETSGTLTDSSGTGNSGSYNGTLYNQTGKIAASLGFDGSNDVVTISDDNSLDITGDITIEFWIYPTNYSGSPDILTKGDYTEAYSVWVNSSGAIVFELNNNSLNSTSNISLNSWSHVALVRSESTRTIYINGQAAGSNTYGTAIGTTNNALTLSTNAYPLPGRLDEVAIYSRGLGATEILDHYRRGATRLKYQVRSCDDSSCSGESYIGPDGTGSTYYDEVNNISLGLPTFSLTNLSANQYFQYQAILETDSSSYTPELTSITLSNDSVLGAVNLTTDEVIISNLVFSNLTATSSFENIRILMTVDYNTGSGSSNPFIYSTNVTSTASVRN